MATLLFGSQKKGKFLSQRASPKSSIYIYINILNYSATWFSIEIYGDLAIPHKKPQFEHPPAQAEFKKLCTELAMVQKGAMPTDNDLEVPGDPKKNWDFMGKKVENSSLWACFFWVFRLFFLSFKVDVVFW